MIVETSRKINFGIYRGTKLSPFGKCDYGLYKDKNIEIYFDNQDKTKLFYVSDKFRNWIKSKLIYFENGIKKVLKGENNERKNQKLDIWY